MNTLTKILKGYSVRIFCGFLLGSEQYLVRDQELYFEVRIMYPLYNSDSSTASLLFHKKYNNMNLCRLVGFTDPPSLNKDHMLSPFVKELPSSQNVWIPRRV